MRVGRMLGLLLLSTGCVTLHKPASLPTAPSAAEADASWAKVLERHVDDKGRVDFKAVASDMGDLDRYVAYVAEESPISDPDKFANRETKLAYYINTYNALALYGVIKAGIPEDFASFYKRLVFFKLQEYVIGGRPSSLYDFENGVIRSLGEPRVHFALNCMSIGCPRLPQEPFVGAKLDVQLTAAAREFMNDSKYVRVDPAQQVVFVSEILKFYTDDFVNPKQASSLVAYVNRFRDDKIPEKYEVKFIEYDWTLARQ